jgi:sulfur carrier protein
MKLIVNGETHDVTAPTLDDLLVELDYSGAWLATAVNGDVVHAGERGAVRLSDGDRVEILSPMKGG